MKDPEDDLIRKKLLKKTMISRQILMEGSFVGHEDFFAGPVYRVGAICTSIECVMYRITSEGFRQMLDTNYPVNKFIKESIGSFSSARQTLVQENQIQAVLKSEVPKVDILPERVREDFELNPELTNESNRQLVMNHSRNMIRLGEKTTIQDNINLRKKNCTNTSRVSVKPFTKFNVKSSQAGTPIVTNKSVPVSKQNSPKTSARILAKTEKVEERPQSLKRTFSKKELVSVEDIMKNSSNILKMKGISEDYLDKKDFSNLFSDYKSKKL